MGKIILYNKEAREKLKTGIDKLAKAVGTTLGPKGRNVIYQQDNGWPKSTRDGVSVAQQVKINDPMENMGAQALIEIASLTVDACGDGTSTSTILAQAIVTPGLKALERGANPMDLKKGIDKAVKVITEYLKSQSEAVNGNAEKLKQVATVSSNGDTEIGGMIAEAMDKVTANGVILTDESRTSESALEIVKGMQFDKGVSSTYFFNNQQNNMCILENPYILITSKRVASVKDIINILPTKKEQQGQSLLIISNDMDFQTLNTLALNKVQTGVKICVVKCPYFGQERTDFLQDIAVLTGGTFVDDGVGKKLENVKMEQLGTCQRVIISKDSTTIIGGNGLVEAIDAREVVINEQIAEAKTTFEKENLQKRIAKLKYGIAIIYIGATTEMELKEKIDRLDDALGATKAAVAEGIVAGGGIMFIKALSALEGLKGANKDEDIGISIIAKAIERPVWQIAENGGLDGNKMVSKIKGYHGVSDSLFDEIFNRNEFVGGDYGYNARTEVFEDLKKAGVIDPTKVLRVALENAASIASMLLTTECCIANEK